MALGPSSTHQWLRSFNRCRAPCLPPSHRARSGKEPARWSPSGVHIDAFSPRGAERGPTPPLWAKSGGPSGRLRARGRVRPATNMGFSCSSHQAPQLEPMRGHRDDADGGCDAHRRRKTGATTAGSHALVREDEGVSAGVVLRGFLTARARAKVQATTASRPGGRCSRRLQGCASLVDALLGRAGSRCPTHS